MKKTNKNLDLDIETSVCLYNMIWGVERIFIKIILVLEYRLMLKRELTTSSNSALLHPELIKF